MGEFLCSFNEGSRKMKDLLGVKGANLSEMTGMGLPVPYGFVVTTKACEKFFEGGGSLSSALMDEMKAKIHEIEEVTGRTFGGGDNPLLVSVRISNVVNIPALKGAVLDLGINDDVIQSLSKAGGMCFALDCYTRFLRTYGSSVRKISSSNFLAAYEKLKKKVGEECEEDEMEESLLFEAVEEYKDIIFRRSGRPFPSDPYEWMTGSAAKSAVKEKADHNYLSGANQTLLNRIDEMDDRQAKEYLKRLVQDKLDVGVQMMDSEGML